jgi:pSer/pThr/pTyr-binding forkhead associated (FHA) protein
VTLPLPESPLAVVGRADPVSNFYPDIDLSPYGALQGGVGRRHMQLKIEDNGVVAEDLDSTNGTALNGNKLVPRTPYPVRDGDELRLGTMVLQIQL